MPRDEQIEFFETIEAIPHPDMGDIEPNSSNQELAEQSKRDLSIGLSEIMMDRPRNYMTVDVPKFLLQVMSFPLDETIHERWQGISERHQFSVETGLLETNPSAPPIYLNVQDLGYLLAVWSIIQNTAWNGRKHTFTTRHIGYIVNGFPDLDGDPLYKNKSLVNGRLSKQLNQALEKAHQRHVLYTRFANKKSSAAGDRQFLTLIEYSSRLVHNLPKGATGKYYQHVDLGSIFESVDESEMKPVDLKLFFGVKKLVTRAALLYLTPILLGGGYESSRRPFKVYADDLFSRIGMKPSTYRDAPRMVSKLKTICDELNGLEGALGKKFHIKFEKKPRRRAEVFAYLSEAEVDQKTYLENLRNTKTFNRWRGEGASEEEYLKRIQDNRKLKFEFEDSIILDKTLEVPNSYEGYFTTMKRLLGRDRFQGGLGEFKQNVKERKVSASVEILQGYLNQILRVEALKCSEGKQ